jgi:hypothetical protein
MGSPPVVYIAGAGRSGSTLLARLLAERSGYVAVGELRYVWERGVRDNHLCECGDPFRQCAFWRDVMAEAVGGMDAVTPDGFMAYIAGVDRIRHVPALYAGGLRSAAFEGRLVVVGDLLRSLYDAILRVSGGRVVVDSSKDPSYAFVLAAIGSIDLGIVHLVRDSRAVAHSWTRAKRRPEIHWQAQDMERRGPVEASTQWVVNNALVDVLQRRQPGFVRMRYEDLVEDPAAHVELVAALHAAEPDPAGVPPGPRFAHSISGNPMRFEAGALRVLADDEWTLAMPARDRRIVTWATAPLLARYGYLPRRTSP